MDDRDQENAGDYGYDLVHEETGRGRAAANRTGPAAGQQRGGPPPAGRTDDRSDDISYDEAHDF